MDTNIKLWNNYIHCVRGRGHREKGMLCQDRAAYKQSESRQVMALVDGIGVTDRNVIAGEKITEALTTFFLNEFDRIMTEKDEISIKKCIMLEVQRIISGLMREYDVPKEEFASTLMVLCVDHSSMRYCGIHLGDGIILCRDDALRIESYPCNGLNIKQTYLTVSESALGKMKLFRRPLGNISEFAMMTDGMYDYPLNCQRLAELIDTANDENAYFPEREDDSSIVVLRRR